MSLSVALWEVRSWPTWLVVVFPCVILLGLELLTVLVSMLFQGFPKIPVKGKHLDRLETIGRLMLGHMRFA